MKSIFMALFLSLTLSASAAAVAPTWDSSPRTTELRSKPKPKPKTVAEGTITKRKRATVVITIDASQPVVGTKAELLKHFDAGFLKGWLSIAAVEVTKVKGKKVTLKILKEKSVTKVNGKKVNHFKKGNRIKLQW